MANLYWDYRGFAEKAYPYLMVSVGGVHHREKMALTNPQSGRGTLPSGKNFGWDHGCGSRYSVWCLYASLCGFTLSLFSAGHVNFRPEPLMYLRGNYSFWFLGFSLMFLF
jgi:hypothetical protein